GSLIVLAVRTGSVSRIPYVAPVSRFFAYSVTVPLNPAIRARTASSMDCPKIALPSSRLAEIPIVHFIASSPSGRGGPQPLSPSPSHPPSSVHDTFPAASIPPALLACRDKSRRSDTLRRRAVAIRYRPRRANPKRI